MADDIAAPKGTDAQSGRQTGGCDPQPPGRGRRDDRPLVLRVDHSLRAGRAARWAPPPAVADRQHGDRPTAAMVVAAATVVAVPLLTLVGLQWLAGVVLAVVAGSAGAMILQQLRRGLRRRGGDEPSPERSSVSAGDCE